MENLSTKEDNSNSPTIAEGISSNAEKNIFPELIGIQTPLNITGTCPPMNQTLSTPHPDNVMTNDTNNSIPRNNARKYEGKISALKSYVQCKLSTLHNKIDRFMET